ncbi:MAG TPA: hypothetical protein VHQ47_11160 [Phycisphaerae bacterium]|jgi:hypothetical protein|nr:hypothetical protein [Phycisphaerae bacterium]
MRFVTRMSELSLPELKALAAGELQFAVSDQDFLDTLARRGCFVLSPWVVKSSRKGGLTRVAALAFDEAGNIDKVRVLVHVARALRNTGKTRSVDFGPRFSTEA